MSDLVILRHGESTWNKENLFTGWVDVELSDKGIQEATQAGQVMAEEGLNFDIVYTSILKRAIYSAELALRQMDLSWLKVIKHWRLNERHYGSLQGLDKVETAKRYGDDQVKIWRRSYDVRPPLVSITDSNHPSNDKKYSHLSPDILPLGECLKDVVERMLPYWHDEIAPKLMEGKNVLIVAHGNSLRALMMHLEKISEQDIMELNLPTGIPRRYSFDLKDPCTPKQAGYMGDQEKLAHAIEAVANQAKPT